MKGERRYSLGAGVGDFYTLSIVVGAAAGVYVAVARRPVPSWGPLLEIGIALTLIIAYYSIVARGAPFRTPGEVMLGRVVLHGRKQWINPYGVNRAALFVVLFTALVVAGNSWDSAADEHLYVTLTLPVVLGRIVLLGCLLAGVMMVGQAHRAGPYLVAGYFGLMGVANLLAHPSAGGSANIIRGLSLFGFLMAILAGVVLVRYQRVAANKAMQQAVGARTARGGSDGW